MKTKFGIVLVLATLVALLLLSTPAVAPASRALNPYEQQLLSLINQQRAKKGLPAVRAHDSLVDAARAHSTDMGESKYFDHNSPTGEDWYSRIIRFGYTRDGCTDWKVGENIYWGAGLFSSPVIVVKAWMGSPAHRAVILTKKFRDIGIGAVKTDTGFGQVKGTVWFFTIDLGRRVTK